MAVISQAYNFTRLCLRLVHTLDWLDTFTLCLSDSKGEDLKIWISYLTVVNQH